MFSQGHSLVKVCLLYNCIPLGYIGKPITEVGMVQRRDMCLWADLGKLQWPIPRTIAVMHGVRLCLDPYGMFATALHLELIPCNETYISISMGRRSSHSMPSYIHIWLCQTGPYERFRSTSLFYHQHDRRFLILGMGPASK